jgi:hypothetical protein
VPLRKFFFLRSRFYMKSVQLIQHREGDRRSRGAILDTEFAEDAFDVLVDRADRRAKNHAFLVEVLAAGLEPRSCRASNSFEEIDRPTRLRYRFAVAGSTVATARRA